MTDINETIRTEISDNDVVLYMKGTPDAPQCGFSAQVVRILKAFGITYKAVDVLADWEIRDGIKQFSNWPTIPQLYVKGEFVGGCDIVTEMVGTGELKALFIEKGIGSPLDVA
ncbi:Grx4 family monothiol glutaredoxin [Agrobacterium rubi]|nr:Grx4 family monothiol glutaredoxin [Agrobacterium rubi]NTF23812.1 Grx4 family monothiol glutaredoxin [Agrobacterium rubi]